MCRLRLHDATYGLDRFSTSIQSGVRVAFSFNFSALPFQDCASVANRLFRGVSSKVQICIAVWVSNIAAKLCPTCINRSVIMQANVTRLAHRQSVTSWFSREQTAELFRVARCGIQHKFGCRVTSTQHRFYQECTAGDASKVQSVHDRSKNLTPSVTRMNAAASSVMQP